MFDRAKDTASSLAKKKMIGIIIGAITGGGCLLPLIIGVAVLIGILAALGIVKTDSDSVSAADGTCSYTVNGEAVSDVKVRLMNCEGTAPVENEELIDFETYITGVVYQESGDNAYEALKAQAVAARSYALTRPKEMGKSSGVTLKKDNGQWILSIRSCTNDQAFCHPDKGCWSNSCGGDAQSTCNKGNASKAPVSQRTIHSGVDKSKTWSRDPLAEDNKVRQAVEETKGQVLLNTKGEIVVTEFKDAEQKNWNSLAKQGKDYFEILMNQYGSKNAAKVEANCSSDSSGDSSIDDADVEKITNLNQKDAWKLLINKSTSEERPYISESAVSKFMTQVKVPIRTWKSGKGHNPRTDTVKKEVTITVNKGLAPLWKAFYNDVYNNAPDFVIRSMDGCYVYKMTGPTPSAHAYGAACDINASTNGNELGVTSYSKEKWSKLPKTRAKYEVVYKGSKIVEIAHKYTLINGSDWRSSNDAMHFSYIRDYSRAYAKKCKGKVTCPS